VETETQPDHASLHQAIVERIVVELRPVRRIWPVSLRLGLWIALEVGLLLLLIDHDYRPDLTRQLRNPWYIFEAAGFAAAGTLAGLLALRAAIPGREPRKVELFLLLFLTVASALLLFHEPANEHLQLADFIYKGVPCTIRIGVFALLPWLGLFWAARRGAPLAAGAEGALIGAAAFLFSFALMRANCPLDDSLHVLMWHLLPALVGVALSACVGVVLFRRRANGSGAPLQP
jgi:hypothetical protein